jgi:hypothetical protein
MKLLVVNRFVTVSPATNGRGEKGSKLIAGTFHAMLMITQVIVLAFSYS